MEALFIGQTYIDVTFLTDRIPTGDEKIVARGLRGQFRRQCRIGSLLLRQARHRARADDLARRRLARPHVSRHGGEVRNFGARPQGQGVLAFLRDAEPRHARDHPLPRRPLSSPRAAARHHRLPRAAPRRPPGRRRDALRQSSAASAASSPRSTAADCARTRWSCSSTSTSRSARSGCASSSTSRRRALRVAQEQRAAAIGGVTLGRARPRLVRRARQRPAHAGTCRAAGEVVDTNGAGDIFHGAYIYSVSERSGESLGNRISVSLARHRRIRCAISGSRIPCRRAADVLAAEQAFREAA